MKQKIFSILAVVTLFGFLATPMAVPAASAPKPSPAPQRPQSHIRRFAQRLCLCAERECTCRKPHTILAAIASTPSKPPTKPFVS
jgi:hypothetical protein